MFEGAYACERAAAKYCKMLFFRYKIFQVETFSKTSVFILAGIWL